jgi:hypothetical protein
MVNFSFMTRISITFALLCLLTGVSLRAARADVKALPTAQANQKEKHAPKADQIFYADGCCKTEIPRDDTRTDKPLPSLRQPEWLIVYITAIYALITALTLVAIWWQGMLIGDSVAIARRQADLMENAERARIIVVASRLGEFSFEFSGRNIGKGGARVTYARGFSFFLDADRSLAEEPAYLNRQVIGIEPVQWVASGADLELVEQKGNGEVAPLLIADLSEAATRNNIQFHRCSLWVFGRITYQDGISAAERETRFCYGFLIDAKSGTTRLYAGGPVNYRSDT